MSIDVLHNKIRKKKNPVALTISPMASQIPAKWLHRGLGIFILWGGIRYLC